MALFYVFLRIVPGTARVGEEDGKYESCSKSTGEKADNSGRAENSTDKHRDDNSEERREYYLKTVLAPLRDQFEYILIDCPPSLSLLTLNALAAADSVLIPIQCEYYALEGVTSLMNTISRVKKTMNPHLEMEGVLLTMLDGRTNLGLQVVEQVKKHFKKEVFSTTIPRNVRLGEAPSHGEPIHLYDPKSAGARAYESLAKEVISRNRKKG